MSVTRPTNAKPRTGYQLGRIFQGHGSKVPAAGAEKELRVHVSNIVGLWGSGAQ